MSLAPATLLLEQFDHLLTTPAAVEELNRAILTLAVQGKLVEQDPVNEPASELLKRIWAEKERLLLTGQLRRDVPLLPIGEDEIPYELPKSWVWVRLGVTTLINMGQSPPSSAYNNVGDGLPFYQGKKDFGEIYPSPTQWCSAPQKIAEEGDVLISVRAPVGPTNLCDAKSCIGRGLAAIQPVAAVSNFYLLYTIRAFESNLSGKGVGTTFMAISRKDLEEFLLPLPPLAEQKRIVARVEALFAQTRQLAEKLARAQRDLALLNQSALAHLLAAETPEDFAAQWNFTAQHFESLFTEPEHIAPLRQAILELAVRGKLTHRESTDEPASALLARIQAEKAKAGKVESLPPVKPSEKPFDLPEGWEWARLKQITTTLQTGPFGSNLHKSDYVLNGVPVVNPVNMRDGKIIPLGEMMVSEKTRERLSQYILETGDLVLARRGEIGRCVLVTEQEDGWLCGTGSLRLKLAKNISKQFIVLLFQTDSARSRLTKETVGITMSNMSQTALENLIFALPPFAEQQRIVAKVEQLLGRCDALEAKLRSAREARVRLTAAVLAGVG